MTQLESAKGGIITPEMKEVARLEDLPPDLIRQRVARGTIVIPSNRRPDRICGIGEGLRTKVNANIGTSPDYTDPQMELEKLRVAEEAGADTVMDLSTGGDIRAIRRLILEHCSLPVGTVPIYEACVDNCFSPDLLFRVIIEQAKDGVDFITVHCAVTRASLETLWRHPRICGIVSRGGTFIARWMQEHNQENPLYERFDELLDIAREYDLTLSLGDGLRPGSIIDAFDPAQVHELMIMAELRKRAFDSGVQVMIEGPGHVPIDQIEAQVKLQKELTENAPFYVLGPIVTDIAPGYDHITSAIGGAIAGSAGADFLCYVTPTEHLGLPRAEDVREGVIAARIAGHCADIAKGIESERNRDKEISLARRARDWVRQLEFCIDPQRASMLRHLTRPEDDEVCSMCGKYCVFKLMDSEKK